MSGVLESAQERREREALAWVQALHSEYLEESMSDADMEAYIAWMEADAGNAEAFRRLDMAWIVSGDAADSIRATYAPEARAAVDRNSPFLTSLFNLRVNFVPKLASIGVAMAVVVAVMLQKPDVGVEPVSYATAVGEQVDIKLADGSVVTLNTDSVIRVTFEAARRTVNLVQGGALFDVARDEQRSFMVRMDGGTVEVLGTVFDVLRNDEGFSVTVLEGRVSVSADIDGPAPNKAVVLTPNEGAEVNRKDASLVSFPVDADAATAWRRGQLIYRDTPLETVLADLNRYTVVPLSLENATIGAQTFTGVLRIEPTDVMMDRLAGLMGLVVVPTKDGGLRLKSTQ